jgi:hypothetical protein
MRAKAMWAIWEVYPQISQITQTKENAKTSIQVSVVRNRGRVCNLASLLPVCAIGVICGYTPSS